MKVEIVYFIFVMTLLSSCVRYNEVVIADKKESAVPDTVYLFLDRSQSNQGFFSKSETINLLGNITTDLTGKKIPLKFYWFTDKCELIADNYGDFSRIALNKASYSGGSNKFSSPLKAILEKKGKNGLAIVMTDAVLSMGSSGSLPQELADIQNSLALYSKNFDENISVFHFFYDFSGEYFAQTPPTETLVMANNVKRNLYMVGFGNVRFNRFLQDIIVNKNKATNYQYYNQAFNQFIRLGKVEAAPLITNSTFKFKVSLLDNRITKLDLNTLKDNFEVLNDKREPLDAAIEVSEVRRGTEYRVNVDLSAVGGDLKGNYFLRMKQKSQTNQALKDLNYNVDKEPIKSDLIDHAKTFSLATMLGAFEYLYQDRSVYEAAFEIKESKKSTTLGGIYTFLWKQQEDVKWIDSVYWKIFLIWLIIPTIFVIFFYFSHLDAFDYSANSFKIWATLCFLVSPLVTFLLSMIVIMISAHGGMGTVIFHSLENAILSIVPFIILSLLIKNQNDNLNTCPI